jgi:hypothetical protein
MAKKSHLGRNILILVVVIVIILIAVALLSGAGGLNPLRPSSVQVSGAASTTGLGTHPVNIGFTSDSGQLFNAAVVNGQYSINLPNDNTYSVQIQWSGLLGASGTCSAGTLVVSQGPGSSGLSNDWSC